MYKYRRIIALSLIIGVSMVLGNFLHWALNLSLVLTVFYVGLYHMDEYTGKYLQENLKEDEKRFDNLVKTCYTKDSSRRHRIKKNFNSFYKRG